MNNILASYKFGLAKWSDYSSLANRTEYWSFVLVAFLAIMATSCIDWFIHMVIPEYTTSYIAYVVALLHVLPLIALTFRRLRDAGHSQIWVLLIIVNPIQKLIHELPPIISLLIGGGAQILLLYFLTQKSKNLPENIIIEKTPTTD